MLWEKKHAGVVGTLIIGIALLLSGGVSQATEENLIAEKAFEVTQPEMMEVTKPEFLKVTEPEMLEVSEPDSLEISKPKSLESGRFPKGKYAPAERENPAYNRCAKVKGFSEQQKCALKALGIPQDEIK
jgi:hypothetical protein